ncbi:MAG: hypothetical protein KKF02_08445 [Proteobacteria bacterium]|nr:hypothetical protein [Pseudomonadota bacterium]
MKGSVYPTVRSFFQTLDHHEVLPQGACVIASIKQVVLADDGVAHPVVKEVVFCLAGHLATQIAAEAPHPNNDEALFQDVQIASDRFHIQLDLGGQLILRHFASHLKGNQLQKVHQCA